MLSIGKLGAGQQQYYLDTVAAGAEEYYTGAKEAPGQWMGQSAERLDLSGEVDAEVLHRVLDSRDPVSGTRLTRAQGAPRVPGFDATFCAPKSVSLLFALGAPEVSNEVRNAHDAAVNAAVGLLEIEASRARRGKAGIGRVVGEGFVAAGFRHRTSRAGDPHLHTHVLVANLVFSPVDGRWSALDARPLYQWAKTAGYLYESQLRAESTRRLGVEWGPVRNGIADLAGIPEPVLRAFSRRRQEIEAFLEESGLSGARAAQVATYATRGPKDREAGPEDLMGEWRARADRLGLDTDSLAALVDRVAARPLPTPGEPMAERVFAWLAGPDVLTAQTSTFGRREVIQALAAAVPRGATIGELVALADAFLSSEYAIPRASGGLRACDVIRRADGTVVIAHVDEKRWTTPEMLATEHALVASALGRVDAGVGVAGHDTVLGALDAHPALSAEQSTAVRRLTGSGAGVDLMPGAAGTGKTHALAVARQAWEASGHRVVGCAVAARTAAQLGEMSGIPSMTLHRLLADLDDPERGGLGARSVVVVDEAAMVGTRPLARLLAHADHAGAKIVFVGDHHQLPEIDAGGAFAGLATRLDVTELTRNRRQRAAWERQALQELRTGDPELAYAAYRAHGRIKHASVGYDIRAELVDDWWAARGDGRDAVMLAGTNRNVDDLNHRARAHLRGAGRLGLKEMSVAGLAFAVGDEVVATRNDYRLGVLNGTRATITELDEDACAIRATTDNGKAVVFPRTYLEAGHLTHGYATTLHKAQGSTVQQAFVLADETLTREHAYVALSRGTEHNVLYIASPPDVRVEECHVAEHEPDPVERARASLRRSSAKTMALDTGPGRLVELRDEQVRLRAAIGPQPNDPRHKLNETISLLHRAEANLEATRLRRQDLEARLDGTRGLRRVTRRDERAELKDLLNAARTIEASHTVGIVELEDAVDELSDDNQRYTAWRDSHEPQLCQLCRIEADINALERTRTQALDRTRTIQHEIDTGLGL